MDDVIPPSPKFLYKSKVKASPSVERNYAAHAAEMGRDPDEEPLDVNGEARRADDLDQMI